MRKRLSKSHGLARSSAHFYALVEHILQTRSLDSAERHVLLAVLTEKVLNPIVGAGTKWQNARDGEKMIQGKGSIMRHIPGIPGISGVKNNSVLAFLLHKAIHQMEYVFAGTKKELPDTYEFLARLQARLGITIHRLGAEGGFDH